MEYNQKLLEVLGALLPALLAAIPGIYALYLQKRREKSEIEKTESETEVIKATTAEKLIAAAFKLQEQYKESLDEINRMFVECKNNLENLVMENIKITKENTITIENLTKENLELKFEIEKLKKVVQILSEQLKELGQKPKGETNAIRN